MSLGLLAWDRACAAVILAHPQPPPDLFMCGTWYFNMLLELQPPLWPYLAVGAICGGGGSQLWRVAAARCAESKCGT